MITIQLPIKILNTDSKEEKYSIEQEINSIIESWLEKNTSPKCFKIKILWGTFYDVGGKELRNGSENWLSLYKTIKNFIYSNKK